MQNVSFDCGGNRSRRRHRRKDAPAAAAAAAAGCGYCGPHSPPLPGPRNMLRLEIRTLQSTKCAGQKSIAVRDDDGDAYDEDDLHVALMVTSM